MSIIIDKKRSMITMVKLTKKIVFLFWVLRDKMVGRRYIVNSAEAEK